MFPTTNKNVLPMTDQSKIVYLLTCECEREYIGKTTQRFGDRIDQHIPQKLIALATSPDKQPEKRRRGRPPKVSRPAQPEDSLRRSQLLKEASQQLESPLRENLPVTLPSDIVVENSDSAVTRHLKSSPKCLYSVCSNVYKHFKFVARARSKCQLDVHVLEAIYISRKQPELCIQKECQKVVFVLR